MVLSPGYYQSEDVVALARDLLGRELVTRIDGTETSGIITETEAYRGPEDRASHAWNSRRTARTEVMFGPGGHAYVYLCYGIHHLVNVVTGPRDTPHAILIRGIRPLVGEDIMLRRRNLPQPRKGWTTGPGSVGKALGLTTDHSGFPLTEAFGPIFIREGVQRPAPEEIIAGPRVGVGYAGEDAHLPWRFRWMAFWG